MTYLRTALLRRAVVAVAALLTAAGSAKADITLDDFSRPNNPSTDIVVSTGSINLDTVLPNGNRNITTTLTSGTSLQLQVSTTTLGRDVAIVNLGADSTATTTVTYTFSSPIDFIPNVPGGGTPGSLVITGFGDADINGVQTSIGITVTTATGIRSGTGNLTDALVDNTFSLASLTGTGDLSQVTGLTLTLTSGQAADLILDNINVTTPTPADPAVPAPPAVLLALIAAPAIGLRLRRKAA